MLNGSSPEVRLPLYFKQKKDPYQAAIEIIADNDSYSIPEDDQVHDASTVQPNLSLEHAKYNYAMLYEIIVSYFYIHM